MSLISIGLSGLNASSAAINTIGNNTANVDTAGYSRQQVMTTASLQQNLGAGFIGSGTTLSDVRRIYNSYLDAQLQTSTSLSADASAYLGQATATDALLSDGATGISSVLATFFSQLQGVSTTATDSASRAQFITTAQSLSARFNSVSAQMTAQSANINTQLTALTGQVNDLAANIASLNKQITQFAGTGVTPNTLLDTRNESVRQLNELVGAKVIENNGSYDVYIGSGQPLVTGTSVSKLSAVPSASDSSQYAIKLTVGSAVTDLTSVVTGGTIGGLLRYRADVMTPAINELGRASLVLADQMNKQLSQGVDNNGNFGATLFGDINSATAIAQRSLGKVGNTAGLGNFDVTITDTSKLTASDYEVTFDNATDFTVRSLPNGSLIGTGKTTDNPATQFDGFSLNLTGTVSPAGPKAGDSFKVTPTRNAAAGITTVMTDPKTIGAAAPLTAAAGVSNGGSGTFIQPVLLGSAAVATPALTPDPTSTADLRTALNASLPVKLVFGAVAADGSQSYRLLNAQGAAVNDGSGNPITGNIVQGQSNQLNFAVGYSDTSTTPATAKAFTFQMTVAGSPKPNDTYTIGKTAAGSSDNRNALATLELQTKQTVAVSAGGNGMSISGAYAKLIQNVGTQASQAKLDSAATTSVLEQAKSSREAVSGVSLDEEAANLIKYQQYYTASSQIIKTAQELFSTLINSL